MSDEKFKESRQRSPAYPAFNLEDAIEKAKTIRGKAGLNAIPRDSMMRALGYSPKSSGGMRAIPTLVSFGLFESERTEGVRSFKLSEMGKTILLTKSENAPERIQAIKQAALMPEIHRNVREKFPNDPLPDDDIIHTYLVRDLNFTDGAAVEFIVELRQTFMFAGIESAGESENNGFGGLTGMGDTRKPILGGKPMQEISELQVPLSGGVFGVLRVPGQLNRQDYQLIREWLTFVEKAATTPREDTTKQTEKDDAKQ